MGTLKVRGMQKCVSMSNLILECKNIDLQKYNSEDDNFQIFSNSIVIFIYNIISKSIHHS